MYVYSESVLCALGIISPKHVISFLITAKDYPIYGVQFHPEKNGFEWVADEAIPHSEHAVIIMQNLANFFVEEGQFLPKAFYDSYLMFDVSI